MQYSRDASKLLLALLLLFTPIFAQSSAQIDVSIGEESESAVTTQERIYDELIINAYETDNAIARAITLATARPMSGVYAFFAKVNEFLDFSITLILFILMLGFFIAVQAAFIALWTIVITVILKTYSIYKVLTAPDADVGYMLEAISKKTTAVSDSLKQRIKKGGSVASLAKMRMIWDML